MSSEAIRIESETLRALRERSAQSGEPMVRLAQRYIGEGMRLDRHPGIVFRNGPAGRRAVVVGGPDVWEVIAAPEHGEELVSALAERIGVPVEKIRIAVRYYAEYPRVTRRGARAAVGRVVREASCRAGSAAPCRSGSAVSCQAPIG
jgi:hypothetical protein